MISCKLEQVIITKKSYFQTPDRTISAEGFWECGEITLGTVTSIFFGSFSIFLFI